MLTQEQKEAARYRYLRDAAGDEALWAATMRTLVFAERPRPGDVRDALDAALDAAISKETIDRLVSDFERQAKTLEGPISITVFGRPIIVGGTGAAL